MRVAMLAITLATGCDLVFPAGDDDGAPDATGGCPASYVHLTTGDYRPVGTATIWPTAAVACENDQPDAGAGKHTHLAVIRDNAELAFVAPFATTDAVWIGLTDLVEEGNFRWITSEDDVITPRFPPLTSPPWGTGQPNNNGDEDCVEIEPGGQLNDELCGGAMKPYVCECDDFPVR